LKDEEWHDEAASLFDKLLRKRQPVMGAGFSSLLARLLRREIDLAEVQSSYKDQPPQVRTSYEWKSLFYAGVRAHKDGAIEETRRLFGQAKERTATSLVFENYLLEHERKMLGR